MVQNQSIGLGPQYDLCACPSFTDTLYQLDVLTPIMLGGQRMCHGSALSCITTWPSTYWKHVDVYTS